MKSYDNLVVALNDLQKRGYTNDFNLKENTIVCNALDKVCTPKEFTILEVHRFEEMSDVGNESVLYVLETKDGDKGIMIDAYGAYSEPLSMEMIEKLRFKK